jgi:hypothetical protein
MSLLPGTVNTNKNESEGKVENDISIKFLIAGIVLLKR